MSEEKIVLSIPNSDDLSEIKSLLLYGWNIKTHNQLLCKSNECIANRLYSEKCFQKDLLDDNTLINVAKDIKGRILGIIKIKVVNAVGCIKRLRVHPDGHRLEIETEMLTHAIVTLREVKKLEVEIEEHDKNSQTLYSKHGFDIIGKTDYEICDHFFELLIMAKDVNIDLNYGGVTSGWKFHKY